MARPRVDAGVLDEVIDMARSDKVCLAQIRALHGLGPDLVQVLMCRELRPGRHVLWRKRLRRTRIRLGCYP
jgi:Protein of unknown function (DUF2805)